MALAAIRHYSTNESPSTCQYQKRTSYNLCYKFKTERNYKYWHDYECVYTYISHVSQPLFNYDGNYLTISSKDNASIYYAKNVNGLRPENFSNTYSAPLSVINGDIIHAYVKDVNGNCSYVNSYKIIK